MDIKEVPTIQARPERYIYHGKNEVDRAKINHGKDQRCVIEIEGIEWPASSPEECLADDYYSPGQWYKALDTGTEYLLCGGCGLDCT